MSRGGTYCTLYASAAAEKSTTQNSALDKEPSTQHSELIGDDRQSRLHYRACGFPVPGAKRDLHGGGTTLHPARTRDELHIFQNSWEPPAAAARCRPMILFPLSSQTTGCPDRRPTVKIPSSLSTVYVCRPLSAVRCPLSAVRCPLLMLNTPFACMSAIPFPTSPHRSPKSFQRQPTRALAHARLPETTADRNETDDRPIGPE